MTIAKGAKWINKGLDQRTFDRDRSEARKLIDLKVLEHLSAVDERRML